MYLDPTIISWVMMGAASACAFMAGRSSVDDSTTVIENTILYLIHNNFIKARKTSDGEWDIIPIDKD